MHLHSAHLGLYQLFNDDGILIALILKPKRVLCVIDKLSDPLPAVTDAPDPAI